jgi:hypothetical protein
VIPAGASLAPLQTTQADGAGPTAAQATTVPSTPTSDGTDDSSAEDLPSWSLPADFTDDLESAFGVDDWAWGQTLVAGLPALPIQTPDPSLLAALSPQDLASPALEPLPNDGPVLQVRFPEGSVNPAASPQGGVGFYAAPSKLLAADILDRADNKASRYLGS